MCQNRSEGLPSSFEIAISAKAEVCARLVQASLSYITRLLCHTPSLCSTRDTIFAETGDKFLSI